jgi:UDP-N-acetylmuramate dehydrogenase
VGAAPIQNIGAYGAEAGNSIVSVTYYDMINDTHKTLTHTQCQFSYRDSIFKHDLKDRVLITSVTIQLSKIPKPVLHY